MPEEHNFETEGDVREFVEANDDKAVKIREEPSGAIYFTAGEDGEFTIILDADEEGLPPHEAQPNGDDYTFDDPAYSEPEVVDADDAPEPQKHPLVEALEEAGAESGGLDL